MHCALVEIGHLSHFNEDLDTDLNVATLAQPEAYVGSLEERLLRQLLKAFSAGHRAGVSGRMVSFMALDLRCRSIAESRQVALSAIFACCMVSVWHE